MISKIHRSWRQFCDVKVIRNPGKCPGPRAWIWKHSFTVFSLFTTRQNCGAFWLLFRGYGNRQLRHLSFLIDLKELNQSAPRFITQELDRNQCIHGRPQKFFQGTMSKFCLSFTGCWQCNANGRSQNALPFVPH